MANLDWKLALVTLAAMLAAAVTIHADAAPVPAASPEAAAARPDATTPPVAALVVVDGTALRAAPRDDAPQHTLLWRGDALELRGERGEYLQVWDHGRERGGWVRRASVHRLPADVPPAELRAVLGFLRDLPGAEALGLALAGQFVAAAPADVLRGPAGADALDAVGMLAERLAERASAPPSPRLAEQAALSGHLDVAQRLGVRLTSREVDAATATAAPTLRVCYDGDAWRRLLAHAAATPEQRAHAALGLTREACAPETLTPSAREQHDTWRAGILDAVPAADLPPLWRQRVAVRRTAVWASLAFARARRGDADGAREASERSLAALADVDRSGLADDELAQYNRAALRANAVRWAAATVPASPSAAARLALEGMPDGQTCVGLVDARAPASSPLVRRCTWGHVWAASATLNREGSALALAVQPTDGWRELWVFRRSGPSGGWTLQVLPPAPATPGLGYAEFAGWVPGGQQLLVAREAIAEGRTVRRFEVLKLDTLTPDRSAFDAAALGAFTRWQDPLWKRSSLALRW